MRYLILGLAIAIAAFFHTSYALAFSSREAGTITAILEQLVPERGESVYLDEDAADDWYEFDVGESGLIADAGYSRSSWRDAYDKTLKGLIALMPETEIEAISAGLVEKVAAIAGLNDEQRREVLAAMEEVVERLLLLRQEGRSYADAVRPFEARLRDLADL